jgi:hypothetical protein
MFARVMCLVPPEELQDVLIHAPLGPITGEDQAQIARMVQEGFRSWNEFHKRFAQQQQLIRQQEPGLATWHDLAEFLRDHARATTAQGFKAQSFIWKAGQVEAVEDDAVVLELPDGGCYACGDHGGAPVIGTGGVAARPLGLNAKPVAEVVRKLAFPQAPAGAAHLRWPQDSAPLPGDINVPFGVLVFLRQTVRADPHAGWTEQTNSLHCYLVRAGQDVIPVQGEAKGWLLRGLLKATVRNKPEPPGPLFVSMQDQEERLTQELRRPQEYEMQQGIRHAVTPLFAALVA